MAKKKKKETAVVDPAVLAEYRKLRERVAEIERTQGGEAIAKALFAKRAEVLFAANPELESFGWKQYTPYFNDGDTCTFGVRADEPDVNGYEYYDEPPEARDKLRELASKVTEFIASFDERDLLAAFGDHAEIVVDRRKGCTVDEYRHD